MKARRVSLVVDLLVVVGLIVLGSAVWPASGGSGVAMAAAPEGTPYKIGFFASITGSGASFGMPQRDTAEMLAKQVADGITGPDGVHHALQFVIYDDESNPDTAASVARRLITQDEVDVVVGGSLTGNSMAAVPLATENQIAMVSLAATRSIIEDPNTNQTRKWIFKTAQDNAQSAEWQALYLKAKGITTVCDLYENTGYGQDCLAQTTKSLKAAGITVERSDAFERTDTQFPQLTSVQASGCQVIVVGAIPPGASTVTAAAREMLPDVPVIEGHGVCNADFIKLVGESAEGIVTPCGRLMVADTLPDTDPQKPVVLKYIADFAAFTNGQSVSTLGGHVWDGVMWSVDAFKSLKDGLSLAERRTAMRDYFENNIKNWPGIGGVFNVTPTDHLGLKYDALTFVKVADGKWTYFDQKDW